MLYKYSRRHPTIALTAFLFTLFLCACAQATQLRDNAERIAAIQPEIRQEKALDPALLALMQMSNRVTDISIRDIKMRWSPTAFQPEYEKAIYEKLLAHQLLNLLRSTSATSPQFEAAIQRLKEREAQVTSPEAKTILLAGVGEFYYRLNEYAMAERYMRLAIDKVQGETSAAMANNIAASFLMRNELGPAEDILNRIPVSLVRTPSILYGIFFNKACIASLKNDPQTAVQHLRQASLMQPQLVMANLGDVQLDPVRQSETFVLFKQELERALSQLQDETAACDIKLNAPFDTGKESFGLSLKRHDLSPGHQLKFPALTQPDR